MKECINNMKQDLISLVIINYNNKDYLSRCMESILNQSYEHIEIIFIDNESKDGSFDYMKEEYSDKNILIIKNEINNGYAGAANQGIKISKGKYVMIINPDIIMNFDFIEKMYRFAETDKLIGAVSGKLLKYDFKKDQKLNYIDSAGIVMFKSTRCIDRGQNEEDLGQYDRIEQVFGVCGAAPMYRRSALEKIMVMNEYFDEDFFAYKEDIDLSLRLNLIGFKNMYYPEAVAYHGRGLGGSKGGVVNFIKNRKKQSEFLRGISHRNHIMMVEKNDFCDFFKINRFKILRRNVAFNIYLVIFERFIFKYKKEARENSNKMIEKRNQFLKKNSAEIKNINHLIM